MVTLKWEGTQTGTYASPIWFNDLELNNYYGAGLSSSVSIASSTANLGRNRGLKLSTTSNGDPGTETQCAKIYAANNGSINASEFEYLTFSVKDEVNQDGCTVKVTFVDGDGTKSSSWSHEKTVYDNWTRIWIPIAGTEGFDRKNITEIRLGFYWRGDYYIDDLSFCYAYNDGLPDNGTGNLAINPSFEDDGSKIMDPKGWHFEGANPEATYLEKNDHSPSGRFHLVHYSSSAHDCYTWQTVYGLTNGTYTLKAMVESGGGQTQNKILATDFGLTEKNVNIPVTSTWTQVEITDIHVTNNKCTIAFYTEGNAGDWSCADDFELIRTGD